MLLIVLLALAMAASTGFLVVVPPRARVSSSVRLCRAPSRLAAAPSNSSSLPPPPEAAATPRWRPPGSSNNRRPPGRGGGPSTVIEFSMRRAGYTPAIDLLEAALGAGTPPEACEEGLFGAALRVGWVCGLYIFWMSIEGVCVCV